MRIKHRPEDFRVRELLAEGYMKESVRHRVYRVKKPKRTSLEAAAVLAELAGCPTSEVGMAGLKDRQGVTIQYMSVPVKKPVWLDELDLSIEPEGFADEQLESRHSQGNAFEVRLRGLSQGEFRRLEPELEAVRAHGVINYFGDQRFGNLRFGQGWIARELALEGRLYFPRGALAEDPGFQNRWRLPGPRLEDVANPRQRELYEKALELEELKPGQFTIEGISGFQLKGEDRELVILPRRLRCEEVGRDTEQGLVDVRLAFELPRGAYATMLLARLFPTGDVPLAEDPQHADKLKLRHAKRDQPPRPPRRGPRRP